MQTRVSPLSPRARALVATLEREPSLRDKLLARSATDVDILGNLTTCAELASIPHLLPFIFGEDRRVAHAAATALEAATRAATVVQLAQIEEACRRHRSPMPPFAQAWGNLQPADVSRVSAFGAVESCVLGVTSFNANGYIREVAVTRLDALSDGRELPFLVLRLNDWVTPVAERARTAVERRLVPAYGDAVLDSLPLLLRLGASKRREHAGLLTQVFEFLRAPAQAVVLRRGLSVRDRIIRRVSFRLAREADGADASAQFVMALRDADTMVRLEAVAAARRGLATVDLASALAIAVEDPYPPIRREGIAAAAERLGDGADAWLLAAVMDRNRVVREVARFYAGRRGLVRDFAAFYRVRLRDGQPPGELATALSGIGETGNSADASAILPFLGHSRPAVRQAAMRGLATVDFDANLARIVAMLDDPAPTISRAARALLRPRAGAIGLEELRRRLRRAPYAHTRFAAASLGASLGKWDSLTILLEAAAASDERIQTPARKWLDVWLARKNRVFTHPTPAQLREASGALDTYHSVIDPKVVEELRAILRDWAA
jgi:hypothetical protein